MSNTVFDLDLIQKTYQNLESKVEEQSDKLDQITSILNAISEKTSAS